MTGLLKDVMHDRADSLDAPDLDVAAMLRDGDRQVRTRLTGVVGAVAASLVVVAGIAVPTLLSDDSRGPDVATPVVSYELAYALGGTIHDGSRTVETDLAINALVQAPSGYVVADRQGRVHTVVDGESQQVGRLADPDRGRLVSDDDVVAWVDAADAGTLSVLDLATNDRVDVPVADLPGDPVSPNPGSISGAGADIVAVDGRTVYVPDARGVLAWDALDGEDPVLLPAPDGVGAEVLQVEDGEILQVATSFEPQEVDGSTTMVQVEELRSGPDLLDTRVLPGTGGALSPDGQRAVLYTRVSPPDGVSYYTTVLGEVGADAWTPVAPEGYDSVLGYQWLDADTFATSASISTDTSARQDLLTCEADTATCTVAVRGGGADQPVIATGRVAG
jgi:hypothetical protein